MFKNLMLYHIGDWPKSAKAFENAISKEPFAECSDTQAKSCGWVSPRGEEFGALVETIDGQWLARYAIETKSVPGQAVRRWVDEKVQHIEKTRGRKPGKKEIRELREDAFIALLPRAFPRHSEMMVWIEPKRRWLAIDSSSQTKADEVIASLGRIVHRGFAIEMLQTKKTPQSLMMSWLLETEEPNDEQTEIFHVERDCELKASGEEPAIVRFTRHELDTPDVRQHVQEGKCPVRLALSWQGRVGFTLTESMQLRKIRFDEGLFGESATEAQDRFDGDVAIATGELTNLIEDLVDALGGATTSIGSAAGSRTSSHSEDNPEGDFENDSGDPSQDEED